MKNSANNDSPRRQMACVGTWNTIQLDYRSPYVVTFWSIAYAGLGHIMLDRYFRGFILLAGEILLNFLSHLNTAIYYSLTLRFELAKGVLDTRWFLLYLGVYGFAIFDSYREAVDVNNVCRLADRENAKITSFSISSGSYNHLSSVIPWHALFWAAVFPGSGCFLIQRMNRALFLMLLWCLIAAMSGVYTALTCTLLGRFEAAKAAVDLQWYLNLPSIWFFSVYEAFQCTLENNRLYRRELRQHLQGEYQNAAFDMPCRTADKE